MSKTKIFGFLTITMAFFLLFLVQNVKAAPVVTIISPTASSTYNYANMNNYLTISGTASSSVSISHVNFTVDTTGDFGTTTGTSTWSAIVDLDAIKDVITTNIITVTATDANGSSTSDVLTVDFNWQYPIVSFASTSLDVMTDSNFRLDLSAYNIIRASSTDVSFFYDPDIMYYSSKGIGSDIVSSSVSTTTIGDFEKLTLHSVVKSVSSTTSYMDLGWVMLHSLDVPGQANIVFNQFTIYRDSGGNINASTGTNAIIDIGNPTITIDLPSYDSMNYYSSSNSMPISGSATDNIEVSAITYMNNRGGSGTASITGSGTSVAWDDVVTLSTGINIITFEITDSSGNTAADVISVNYLPNNPVIQFSTSTKSVVAGDLFSFDIGANYLSEAWGVDFHLLYNPSKFVYDSVVFSGEGTDYSVWSSFNSTSTINATTEDAYFMVNPDTGPDNTTSGVNFGTFTFRALESVGSSTISFATSTEGRGVSYIDSAMSLGSSLVVNVTNPTEAINPVIAINYPATSTTFNYYSSTNTITLQGTSTDNVAVSSVTYVNSLGGSGTMTGTSSWTGIVTLMAGANVITVTAHDSSNNTSTDTITINYIASNPVISFSTTTLTKATSTNFSFNVLGNYISEAQTIGLNIFYNPSLVTYSTSTYSAGINSALSSISSSTSGGLRKLTYSLRPNTVPFSASSSLTLFTPTFTTLSTSGTTTAITFGTSTINRTSFNSNISTSTTILVTVPSADISAPVRSGGLPSGAQTAGVTSVVMSLTTNENATCRYSNVSGTAYASMTPFSTTGGTSHSTTLSGLVVATYNYYVRCQDSALNTNLDDYTISFSTRQSSSSGGSSGGSATTPVAVEATNAPMIILSNQSGTLTRSLGTGDIAKVVVPVGSVTSNTTIDAFVLATSSIATTTNDYGLFVNGKIFSLSGVKSTGESLKKAEKSMDITWIVSGLIIGNNNRLLYFDESSGKWIGVTGTVTIDYANRKVSFATSYFGKYALFANGSVITVPVASGVSSSTVKTDSATKTVDIVEEAKIVSGKDMSVSLDEASKKIYIKISTGKTLDQNQKYALAYFIQSGTYLTKKLGAGERAGVVNSFFSAFGRMPKTETDWQDVIKIGTGRWPGQKNLKSENNAKVSFKKIYKRDADMKNARDNAAVTIIAYGLRSVNRSTVNEANSIRSFKAVYGYAPVSATAWDIIRAIAYSGAKR